MSNSMANNGGKLARSSTLKLIKKLGSNHCADDPMKGMEPHTKKRKVERGGGGGMREEA